MITSIENNLFDFGSKMKRSLIFSFMFILYLMNTAHADQGLPPVNSFFLLNSNKQPAFWGGPIVPRYYDETGKHAGIFKRTNAFAAFYAMAAEEEMFGPISSGFFDDSKEKAPTLGMVIADYKIEGDHLALPLRETLQKEWSNAPISGPISHIMARVNIGSLIEGNQCNLFVDGENVNQPNTAFRIDSVVILAHSDLPPEDIMLCFRDKVGMAFGIAPEVFEQQKTFPPANIMPAQFSLSPLLLNFSATCKRIRPADVLSCVNESVEMSHRYMLNIVDK